jgi:hypothetical protein
MFPCFVPFGFEHFDLTSEILGFRKLLQETGVQLAQCHGKGAG